MPLEQLPVEIQVFGELIVRCDGHPVELTGDRQRRAILALAAAGPSGADSGVLAETIWDDPDRPSDSAAHVRTLISRLRARIARQNADRGSPIAGRPGGYRFDEAFVAVDLWRFEEGLADAEAETEPRHRRHLLDAVLPTTGGDPYTLLADLPALAVDAARRSDRWFQAEQDRLQLWLNEGLDAAVIDRSGQLLDTDPYREHVRSMEVVALYRSGRQADALRRLEGHRLTMAEDLGLEPAPELVDLELKILRHDGELLNRDSTQSWVRGYALGEEVARDDLVVIHLAEQVSIGRAVTIEVVRADFANQASFVRQFEAEAQRFARLEHPNLVPLYDYWREPDRACLVFPALRARPLDGHLHEYGSLPLEACHRLIRQIGTALTVVHEAGLAHGNVGPPAVFVDADNNFFLGRFPIAGRALSLESGFCQEDAEDGSPSSVDRDLNGFSQLVRDALAQPPPNDMAEKGAASQASSDTDRPSGPRSELHDLLDELDSDHPTERFPSMAEATSALLLALDPGSRGVDVPLMMALSGDRAPNPYQGLRPFSEADRSSFFGREDLVDRMLAVLNQDGRAGRILAVVGPSGVGKSSTVMAGLVPAVREGRLRSSANWLVTTMTPGREPFGALASALLRVSSSASTVAEARLRSDQHGLARAAGGLVGFEDSGLLLVIDQFEELFTGGADVAEQREFLDLIETAVTESDHRFRVVVTIRADFWDRPLQQARFAELIESSTVHVRSMRPSELERAIVQPAASLGVGFEDGLVSTLVADVAGQIGGLPLVQVALAELWDQMPVESHPVMMIDAYRRLGGAAGAASAVADSVYLELDEAARRRIREAFGRMTIPGRGAPDTRRSIRRADLGDDPVTEVALERFGRARLLSFDRDSRTRDPMVEIAHDALLDGWPRLQRWLEEDRVSLTMLRHLAESAAAWQAGGADEGDLYRGGRLEAVEAWTADHNGAGLSANEAAFVTASLDARQTRDDAERSRLVNLRRGLVVAATIALVAVVATVFSVDQRRSATDASFRSDTLVMIRGAESVADTTPDLALQLAVSAVDRGGGPAASQALINVLRTEPRFAGVVGTLPQADCWTWTRSSNSPSAILLADPIIGSSRTIRYAPGPGEPEQSRSVAASSSCPQLDPLADQALVVGNNRLDIVSFSADDVSLDLPVTVAGWATDGSAVVSLGLDRGEWWLQIHARSDLSVVAKLKVEAVSPVAVEFAPTTNRVLILESGVGGRRSSMVDMASGAQVTLEHRAELFNAELSLDGDLVVGVDATHLHVWDAATGLRRDDSIALAADGYISAGLALNPTATIVAIATGSGVELYDLVGGEVSRPLAVEGSIRFVGDDRLLVVDTNRSVYAYELGRERLSRRLLDWSFPLGIVAPDGSVAISRSDDAPLGFDLRTGESFPIPTINARAISEGRITGYDSERKEYFLVEDGTVVVRADLTDTVPSGLENMRMPRAEYGRTLLQLSDPSDGEMASNRLLVIGTRSGELLGALDVPGVYLSEFVTPDEILVARQGSPAQLLGIDGSMHYQFPSFESAVTAGDSRPDGDLILGLESGTTVAWSRSKERVTETLTGPGSFVVQVLPVEDGVIIQHDTGEILRWRWGTTEPVGQLIPPGDFGGLAHLTPDGSELIVPIGLGIEAFPISVDRWRQEACKRIPSTIDGDRWTAATGLDPPTASPCRNQK